MAAPSTSARSQAAMAISHSTQRAMVMGRGYVSRQACARSRPVTMPRRALSVWSRMAMQVGHQQDPEQAVAEARAAFQVGGPVAGVHVADADQVGGAGEGEHTPPEGHLGRADGGVDIGQ